MLTLASNAILAKARAMYASHLTTASYEELLKKDTLEDVFNYLKQNKNYEKLFSNYKDVTKQQFESLLNEGMLQNLSKLNRYASKKELPFYKLALQKEEISLLVTKIRSLYYQYEQEDEYLTVRYLHQYSSFNLYNLIKVENKKQLLDVMKHTRYYKTLLKHIDETIDFNMLEKDLGKDYYDALIECIKNTFKGKQQKEMLTMIYSEIELENIIKIYRIKKYFINSNIDIESLLYNEYSRIPSSLIKKMIEAKDIHEFLSLLESSPYHLFVDEKEYVYIEYYASKIKYNLAKRYMRYSTCNSLVYMTYKIILQIEIENLKHIVEGLEYRRKDEVSSILIYSD